nr:flagellar GTP-binding protein FlhF [Neokomagataea anthophila]
MGTLDLARGAPPLVVCGVPGSGKTLAVTRLATRMVLAGRDPLVVTMDTERSGAFEQLSACMDILGVELRAVETPDALKTLHAREGQRRMMLVDTFGVSPWDAALMSRLVQIKKAVHADLAVVHPAGGHVDETCDTLAAFQRIGANNLIVSKTDCTRRMGDVVQASLQGLSMVEVSSGRGVIDGLRPVTPKILRDVLLDMQRRAPAAGRKMNMMKPKSRESLMVQPHTGRAEGLRVGRSVVPKNAEILARHMLAQGRV